VRRREISVLVDELNDAERALKLPEIEGLYDNERMEMMDILARIERRIMANQPMKAAE
jgi:hypothetical protein